MYILAGLDFLKSGFVIEAEFMQMNKCKIGLSYLSPQKDVLWMLMHSNKVFVIIRG